MGTYAKGTTVEAGITTFETEFLPYTMVPGTNSTAAEWLLPQLEQSYLEGKPMRLLSAPAEPQQE